MNARAWRTLAMSVGLLLAPGCDDNDVPPDVTGRVEAVIGAEGGTLEVTRQDSPMKGVKLTVPAGAVSGPTTFFIELVDAPGSVPDGLSVDYPTVKFGPATTIVGDLELTLPVTYLPTGDGHILAAYCWNATKARWAVIPPRQADAAHIVVPVRALGLCRWGTVRLGEVSDDTVRGWMEDLPSLVDDWATYRATLVARLAPFQTMIEDVSIATKCATQQGAIDWLTRSRQSSLDAVTAYLSSQTVVNACRICDRGGGCQASVCDADSLISGEPLLWLGNEIKIWWQAMIISSVCPVDALGPLVEKLVALAKYQAAIRELNCDWRCVIEHGTHDFFGELLYGNVCTFSIFALELYQEHNPCE